MTPTITIHCKSIKEKATKFFCAALMEQHIIQTQNTINKWKRDLDTDEIDTKWETICSKYVTLFL